MIVLANSSQEETPPARMGCWASPKTAQYGSVAQSGERQPVTLEVAGSKPARVATEGSEQMNTSPSVERQAKRGVMCGCRES